MAQGGTPLNKKQFIHKLGLAVISFGERWFRIPDVAKAERRGASLGMLLYRLDKKHRKTAISNLEIAFPELTERDRVQRTQEMFRHFGRIVADFIRSPIRTDEEVLSSTTIEGVEHLDEAMAGGNGILYITAHFGNWERMGQWIGSRGIRITSIARDSNETLITDKINAIRKHRGNEILSRGNAAREVIRRLRANEMIGILPDQNADESYIPFFGKPAGTVLGPAVLHLRTQAPILPVCSIRTGPGQYRQIFFPLIRAEKDETSEALMTRVNQQIENMIRLAPEQYLWMHDRWRYARQRGLL